MYNLSTVELANLLMPPFLKKDAHLAWIECLLEPLATLNSDLLIWVNEKQIELEYTGQTLLLEKMLNDKFDPIDRRIVVVHQSETRESDYLRSEATPGDFDYLISEAETARFMEYRSERSAVVIDGFDVRIPTEYTAQDDQIRGKILNFKVAAVNYSTTYV